jgi:methylated-DNA-[protein]-cysteine S-methyltransferase
MDSPLKSGARMRGFLGVVMPRHAATVCFSSPLGLLEVECADTGVTRLRLGARGKAREVGDGDAMECARKARGEILAYLEGGLKRFTVPVVLAGTPFQRTVWAKLLAIPYGKTRTYGEIAAELGKPRAARAVGMACGANPVPILVPCHRIVAGNGGLGGFGGGARMKHDLLELERTRAT